MQLEAALVGKVVGNCKRRRRRRRYQQSSMCRKGNCMPVTGYIDQGPTLGKSPDQLGYFLHVFMAQEQVCQAAKLQDAISARAGTT